MEEKHSGRFNGRGWLSIWRRQRVRRIRKRERLQLLVKQRKHGRWAAAARISTGSGIQTTVIDEFKKATR